LVPGRRGWLSGGSIVTPVAALRYCAWDPADNEDISQVASKPDADVARSRGRKRPSNMGCSQLEVSLMLLLSAIGTTDSRSVPDNARARSTVRSTF